MEKIYYYLTNKQFNVFIEKITKKRNHFSVKDSKFKGLLENEIKAIENKLIFITSYQKNIALYFLTRGKDGGDRKEIKISLKKFKEIERFLKETEEITYKEGDNFSINANGDKT